MEVKNLQTGDWRHSCSRHGMFGTSSFMRLTPRALTRTPENFLWGGHGIGAPVFQPCPFPQCFPCSLFVTVMLLSGASVSKLPWGSSSILKVKSRLLGIRGSSMLSSSLPKLNSQLWDWAPSPALFQHTSVYTQAPTHGCLHARSRVHTQASTHTNTRVMILPGSLHCQCSFHYPGPRDPRILCNSYPRIRFAPPYLSYCYRTMFVSPKFMCWNPNSLHGHIWRQDLQKAINAHWDHEGLVLNPKG